MIEQQSVDLMPRPEHRRIAAQQYERARQAISTQNYDYGIELLQTSCKLDPGNLVYRQTLRKTEKTKYKNNLRGSWFAWLTTARAKFRLNVAKRSGKFLQVLQYGEAVLARNPWDTQVQLDMAAAADDLGLLDVAIYVLEQARQKNPKDIRVNRPLAHLYEKQGNFAQAIVMWDLVFKTNPRDDEAARKGKDLAAENTIVKGNYEEAARGGEHMFLETAVDPGGAPARGAETPRAAHLTAVQAQLARQIEPLRARMAADPANPNNYLRIAEIFRNAEQLNEARQILEAGLAATGRNFEIQLTLTELEIEPFRHNLKLTEEKLKASPADEKLQHLRVRLRKEINTREMELYRQRTERYPSDHAARLELGIRLLRAGQTDAAIQELQAARKDPRHRWRGLLYLGFCFKAKNNWGLAKRNFAEALETLPPEEEESRKELLFQLARGAADTKDWPTALAHGNELANLDFSYRDIGRLLDEWQRHAKQPDAPA
jgi:tetratricopeptide (TPR) repeat protein